MNKEASFYTLYASKLAFVIVIGLLFMSVSFDIPKQMLSTHLILIGFMFYYQFRMCMGLRDYKKIKERDNER